MLTSFKQASGSMWDMSADAYCITTNGFVKKNGEAVMGAGCAKEATKRYPGIAKVLGDGIHTNGNRTQLLWQDAGVILVSFPVKHNWWEKADIELIKSSAHDLMMMIRMLAWQTVLLPRPGCGNGKLLWTDVSKVLEPILDERVTIVSY